MSKRFNFQSKEPIINVAKEDASEKAIYVNTVISGDNNNIILRKTSEIPDPSEMATDFLRKPDIEEKASLSIGQKADPITVSFVDKPIANSKKGWLKKLIEKWEKWKH